MTKQEEAAYRLNWQRNNRDKISEYNRRWREKNPEQSRQSKKRSREKYPETDRIYAQKYHYLKYHTDLDYKILKRIRNRIGQCIRRNSKSGSALTLLGCSILDFKIYIESRFEVGMSWENYGNGKDRWHLDHIMPCAIFDLARPEHQRRCFHFSNYQPLWQPDNTAKGAKSIGQFNLL